MTVNRNAEESPENAELHGDMPVRSNHDLNPQGNHADSNLRGLFPNLPEDQLNEVAETLHGYCVIVWRIYERLARERPEVIDELMRSRSIKGKVDSSK